jgi:uncharacterized protein
MELKVIIDTNVLISFLIGKRLGKLKAKLSDLSIKLIYTEQLIEEIKLVTTRPKFKRYFNRADVNDFISLISVIGINYTIDEIPNICRDAKDDFLLALCLTSNAGYLVTGDKDLLELKKHGITTIITASEFDNLL